MSFLSKVGSTSLSEGLVVVDVNPAFVISIASADVPVMKGCDRKITDRHWSSKSARSRLVRQRFSEMPYHVPEPHSVIRRHSTENWSTIESPSFGVVIKTAERLLSGSCECTSSIQTSEDSKKVGAAVSVGALATCDGNPTDNHFPQHNGGVIARSRSLDDLTQPWSHHAHGQSVDAIDIALQNELLIDRVERKLRNFHVT